MLYIFEKFKYLFLGGELPKKDIDKYLYKVGNNVHIYSKNIDLKHGKLISIGSNVLISNATILCHDASTEIATGYARIGKVSIGSNVFVGAGTIILPNTSIGNNVIIGAGSIVTKDVPDNSVVAGNPARVIKEYNGFVNENKADSNNSFLNSSWAGISKKEKEKIIEKVNEGGIYYY